MTNVQIGNSVKAGGYTALWTFIAMFGLAVLGWLNAVVAWATSTDVALEFPDPTVLVKALVAATAAAFTGILATLVRLAQSALGKGIPQYGPPAPIGEDVPLVGDEGQSTLGWVVIIILVVLVTVLLVKQGVIFK